MSSQYRKPKMILQKGVIKKHKVEEKKRAPMKLKKKIKPKTRKWEDGKEVTYSKG